MKRYYLDREVEVLDRVDPSGLILEVRFKDTGEIKKVHTKFLKNNKETECETQEELKMEILKKGTKVVPHKKSYGGLDLSSCHHWNNKGKEQGYLYVIGMEKLGCKDFYILNANLVDEESGGNYYLREDFEIFNGEELDKDILYYADIDVSLDIENEECENFFVEMLSDSKENLMARIKGKRSIVTMSIADTYDLDPHFTYEELQKLHEWTGNVLKFIEQENKPREMTIEEIENILGYKVVIKNV